VHGEDREHPPTENRCGEFDGTNNWNGKAKRILESPELVVVKI